RSGAPASLPASVKRSRRCKSRTKSAPPGGLAPPISPTNQAGALNFLVRCRAGTFVPDRIALQCATATCSRAHALSEPFNRGLRAALAVRDAERAEPDVDDAEGAQRQRGIDGAHAGDA